MILEGTKQIFFVNYYINKPVLYCNTVESIANIHNSVLHI